MSSTFKRLIVIVLSINPLCPTLLRFVNLVCLPQAVAEPSDGTKCWITGWGRLASGGAVPDYLQQVQVPVVSRARCDQAYPGKIDDSMVCAGLDQGGINSCQGDRGDHWCVRPVGSFIFMASPAGIMDVPVLESLVCMPR